MSDIQKIRGCIRKSINKLVDEKILESDKNDFKIKIKEYTKGFSHIEMRLPKYNDRPLSFDKLEHIVEETNDCIVDIELDGYRDDLFVVFTPREYNG